MFPHINRAGNPQFAIMTFQVEARIICSGCFPRIDLEDITYKHKANNPSILRAQISRDQARNMGLPIKDKYRLWMWHSTGKPPTSYHPDQVMGSGGRIGIFLTDASITFKKENQTCQLDYKAGTAVFFPHYILEEGCGYLHKSGDVKGTRGTRTVIYIQTYEEPADWNIQIGQPLQNFNPISSGPISISENRRIRAAAGGKISGPKNGKINGPKDIKICNQKTTFAQRSRGGKVSIQKMAIEQRSRGGKKGIQKMAFEQMSRGGKKGADKKREEEYAKELITEKIRAENAKRDCNKCQCGKVVQKGGDWKKHVIRKHIGYS
jgi:hypothetical protein